MYKKNQDMERYKNIRIMLIKLFRNEILFNYLRLDKFLAKGYFEEITNTYLP